MLQLVGRNEKAQRLASRLVLGKRRIMVGAGREHVLHWRDLLGVKLLFAPEILGGNSLERAGLEVSRFGLAKLDAAEQHKAVGRV